TFSRDASRLTASGWQLSTLDLLDLFPNTHHVETLASFELQNDVPAALPLIAFIAGLVCGCSVRDTIAFLAVAVLLAALRHFRAALVIACVAFGIIAASAKPSPIAIEED